jgi:uncharacterized protein (TIGR02391 family)
MRVNKKMAKRRLDRKLLDKIAQKLGKNPYSRDVNVKVSKKAASLGISSEAALVIIAKELGIGTAHYQRKLDPTHKAEIRESLPSIFGKEHTHKKMPKIAKSKSNSGISRKNILKSALEYLLLDDELHERCQDLLLAKSNFDRPISQATLVLEDRIRNKSQPSQRLVGEALVRYAFNPELSNTVLKISDNPEEQKGFTLIMQGMVPAFRNITHHHVTDSFSREDALRVCAFIDVLLKVVDNSKKVK